MRNEYRIVHSQQTVGEFVLEIKRWFWPFWQQLFKRNNDIELLERFALEHADPLVKYLGRLP